MPASDIPNILFIMTDQHRWDALGCAGGWVDTPTLDSIAAAGVRFTNCVTNSPACVPARISLATGQYPHNSGILTNCHYSLPEHSQTWMRQLRSIGYRTSLFGKTHLHPHAGDLREREYLLHAYGLDDVNEIAGPRASREILSHMTAEWDAAGLWEPYRNDLNDRYATKPHVARPSVLPLRYYADTYVGQKAKRYLAEYDDDQPWFCWVSFGGPHEPWDAPEPYASRYEPDKMPAAIPAVRLKYRPGRPRGILTRRLRNARGFDSDDVARLRANYAGNVTLIDDQIRQIIEVVRRRGEFDNTVVVFTSDHGEMNGDHGLLYKSVFLDGAVMIPLLIKPDKRWKLAPTNRVSDTPVELFDVGPTLVDLAGTESSYRQFGKSLVAHMENPSVPHRDSAIAEFKGEVMILTTEWKLVLNNNGEPYLLFDRKTDPAEQRNLAFRRSHETAVETLRRRIFERIDASQI